MRPILPQYKKKKKTVTDTTRKKKNLQTNISHEQRYKTLNKILAIKSNNVQE